MGLLERLGIPNGRAAKVIDGQHPEPLHTSTLKPDMLPISDEDTNNQCVVKRNILVAATGTDIDNEIVSIACNLSKTKKGGVFVVFGIEVPRKLAIDAEMTEETRTASAALDHAAGVAEQLHVRIDPEIVQSRHFGQSLVEEAVAHECALLILGLPYQLGVDGHFDLGDTADYVLKNAPCRVWLVRGQQAQVAERSDRLESLSATR